MKLHLQLFKAGIIHLETQVFPRNYRERESWHKRVVRKSYLDTCYYSQ